MFSKCANPRCATVFDYRLGGKFFRFHQNIRAPQAEHNTHEVIHFWLCESCAEKYTLDYDGTCCEVSEFLTPRLRRREERVIWYEEEHSEELRQSEQEEMPAGRVAQAGQEKGVRT